MRITILSVLILICLTTTVNPISASTAWDSQIQKDAQFNWKTETAELRDLQGSEEYDFGIGGINIPGGDIEVTVSETPTDFDFFENNSLFDSVTVEGDMLISIGNDLNPLLDERGSFEYLLLILPVEIGELPFFDYFFDYTNFIGNLTHTSLISTQISDGTASYVGQYNNTHTVTFEWDISTGLLNLKEVVSENNKSLRVIQGEGSGFGLLSTLGYTFSLPIFAVIFIGWTTRKARKSFSRS